MVELKYRIEAVKGGRKIKKKIYKYIKIIWKIDKKKIKISQKRI